tara:strand:- start:129 stop:524 length:396 start_codon:yes stop_codon:yes gene_type:complete
MSKTKLNKVVLKNVDAAVIVAKVDNRTNNPGRPINKQSARYKRLAKQAFYTKQNKSFVSGKQFYVPNVISGLHYTKNVEKNQHDLGSVFNELSEHVCTVNYIGRTKVQAFKYVLGKRVNVELNLKTLKYTA